MPQPTVEAYTYAACYTCTWKLSRHGDTTTSAEVHTEAKQHAETHGHRVSLVESVHVEIDCRVEVPS